jgi:hypothetical protein
VVLEVLWSIVSKSETHQSHYNPLSDNQ